MRFLECINLQILDYFSVNNYIYSIDCIENSYINLIIFGASVLKFQSNPIDLNMYGMFRIFIDIFKIVDINFIWFVLFITVIYIVFVIYPMDNI